MFASYEIYFTSETEIDQLKLQIMMQPKKLESNVVKDLLIIAAGGIVIFVTFSLI